MFSRFSWVLTFALVYLLTCTVPDPDVPKSTWLSALIGEHVLLPCGPTESAPNRYYDWYANEADLEQVPDYRTVLPNGTLSIYVRMEDADIVYICNTYTVSADNTIESEEQCIYKIDPQVEAFLMPTVQNVTIDWGTYYTFPCIFSGTLPREELMLLNSKVVTERRHNITSDSVVECIVKNSLNTVHDKAYVKIRPGSQAWNMKYGAPTDSYCLPYSVALNQSSTCRPYLDQLANTRISPYAVARSRLYYATYTETVVAHLFEAWDVLLNKEQLSNSFTNDSQPAQVSYSAWRCVDWAKRLTCALAYPRCENIETMPAHSTEPYAEHPVCPLDCLAVTGLFCMPSLGSKLNSSSIEVLMNNISNGFNFPVTGWDQLMGLIEARQSGLPQSFLTYHENRPDLNSLQACDLLNVENRFRILTPPGSCTKLPLEIIYEDHTSAATIPRNFLSSADQSKGECISGNGWQYRGSVVNRACSSWSSTLSYQSETLGTTGSIWPGLFSLTEHAFPSSIDHEASTAPVCRNPSGLAPAPFCFNRVLSDVFSNTTDLTAEGRSQPLVLCTFIPHCSEVSTSKDTFLLSDTSDENLALVLGAVKTQVIIACALVAFLVCIFIAFYFFWRTKRCGLRPPYSSDPNLSLMELGKSVDEKGNPLSLDGKPIDESFHENPYRLESDPTSEQAYLRHRLQWIKRRRRLRQLHPACRCLVGSCYVLSDYMRCKSKQPEADSRIPMVNTAGSQNDYLINISRSTGHRNSKKSGKPGWSFGRCGLNKKLAAAGKNHDERSEPSTACSRIRRLTLPLGDMDDDEFEANALGMQLHKSIAYVANMTASSLPRTQPSQDPSSGLLGICVQCGIAETFACNLCPACLSSQRSNLSTPNGACPLAEPRTYVNAVDEQDPGAALTESSMQIITSGSTDLGCPIALDMLFNWASMTHLLHPKLKEVCYPRNKLIEVQRLAKRAFGWIILARAPNLHALVRRHRLFSLTTAERLGLSLDNQSSTGEPKETVFDADESGRLVVVKMLTNDAGLKTEANFLREAEVLIELSHRNIIQLYGICLPLKPLSLLLEYMPFGDLTTFLRHYLHSSGDCRFIPQHILGNTVCAANGVLVSKLHSSSEKPMIAVDDDSQQTWLPPVKLTTSDLLGIARDACEAMVYLSDKYYIHRDVATRSFLVGNKMLVKLADFSMCQPVQPGVDLVAAQDVYLPIKWLPLESILDGLFHVDTDVWSFGVFLWELFSLAAEPYPELGYEEVISFLDSGGRLSCPPACPSAIFDLMRSCWTTNRQDRPSFAHIRSSLCDISSRLCSQTTK